MRAIYKNLTDEELMVRYQSGEYIAFEMIYLRHKDRVYSYLNKRLSNKQCIDDIFQKIFTKFHKSRSQYSDEYPLLKWLYTLCRNELLDYHKKKKLSFIELDENFLLESDHQDDMHIQLDTEKSLSENEREAISLRYYSDQDFIDISKKLNTSESNVRKIISRGINKLRKKYLKGEK